MFRTALYRMDWTECSRLLDTMADPDAHSQHMHAIVSWQAGDVEMALRHAQAACCDSIQASAPCTAQRYLLGQLLVCRAASSQSNWKGDLQDALGCFEQAAQDAPADAKDLAVHCASCISFTNFYQGRFQQALQAAEQCLHLCGCQEREHPPHVVWLKATLLQSDLHQHDLAMEDSCSDSFGKIYTRLTGPDMEQQILTLLRERICSNGSLIWQGSDLLTALPALISHDDRADAMQLLSQHSMTSPVDWPSPFLLLPEPSPIDVHVQGGSRGTDVSLSASSLAVEQVDQDGTHQSAAGSQLPVQGVFEDVSARGHVSAPSGPSGRSHELSTQLSSWLPDFLCLLLGWQPRDRDDAGTEIQQQQQLATLIQEFLTLPSPGSAQRRCAHTPELAKLQVAMLMLNRLTIKAIPVTGGQACQLMFRGLDESCTSITMMGGRLSATSCTMQRLLATAFRWEAERVEPCDRSASRLALAGAKQLQAWEGGCSQLARQRSVRRGQFSTSTRLQLADYLQACRHPSGPGRSRQISEQVPAALHDRPGASRHSASWWLLLAVGVAAGAALAVALGRVNLSSTRQDRRRSSSKPPIVGSAGMPDPSSPSMQAHGPADGPSDAPMHGAAEKVQQANPHPSRSSRSALLQLSPCLQIEL